MCNEISRFNIHELTENWASKTDSQLYKLTEMWYILALSAFCCKSVLSQMMHMTSMASLIM